MPTPLAAATLEVSLAGVSGLDAKATRKAYCRLALKQPHRVRFLKSAELAIGEDGSCRFNEVLTFDDVAVPAGIAAAEGKLVIDVWGRGDAPDPTLIGKQVVPLNALHSATSIQLISGSLELKATLQLSISDTTASKAGIMSAEELASFTFEGQRARPRKKIEYAPIRNTTYLKPPGSCNTKWKTAGKAVGVNVECVEDSKIYILDACEQVSVAECTRCRVVVAPTSGSVFLIDMVDCVISVAAKQIRLRNCQRCELRVFVPSREGLIIEVCSDLTIGAWELSYPELSAQFALSKIDDKATNHWNEVYNFSPEVGSGPHFTLLKTQPPSKRLVPKPEGLCGGSVMELGEGEVGTFEVGSVDVSDDAGTGPVGGASAAPTEEYLEDYEDDFEPAPAAATAAPVDKAPPAGIAKVPSSSTALNERLKDYDDAEDLEEEVMEEEIVEEDDVEAFEAEDEPSPSTQNAAAASAATDPAASTGAADPAGEEPEEETVGSPPLLARISARAAKDAEWAGSIHAFIHGKAIGFNPSYSGQIISSHTRFQELLEEALDKLLARMDIGQEELVLALIGTSAEDIQVPPDHRACALEILALDSMESFELLLRDEARAAKEDPVRKAGLQALATPDWLEAVRGFVSSHTAEFQGDGGSQLTWTQRHEEYQEVSEALLEDLLGSANVDASGVLQALCRPSKNAPGVTPLPTLAWLPLRAFVDYKCFERMMISGL